MHAGTCLRDASVVNICRLTRPLTRRCCPSHLASSCALDIHFQYNGFLLGLFLLSITAIMREENLWAAFWFAVLLQSKHIFLYVAPVYFVYLLMNYCMRRNRSGSIVSLDLVRLASVGSIVLVVFGISLGPFIVWGQLPQLLSRLFPFQRGLCHAYWAPNVWVFYNIFDKLLILIGRRYFGFDIQSIGPSTSSGLVEEIAHVILPNIKSGYTFIMTIAMMMVRTRMKVLIDECFSVWAFADLVLFCPLSPTLQPVLIRLGRKPHPAMFLSSLIYCSLCSFMLGQFGDFGCWSNHNRLGAVFSLSPSLV